MKISQYGAYPSRFFYNKFPKDLNMLASAGTVYEELLWIKKLNFSKFEFLEIIGTQILH